MRKLAYCPNCEKHCKLTISIIAFKHFTPLDDEHSAIYVDVDLDENPTCVYCGHIVELTEDEKDEVVKAAFVARGY